MNKNVSVGTLLIMSIGVGCSSGRLSNDKDRDDYNQGSRAPVAKDNSGNVASALVNLAMNPSYYNGNSELIGKCIRGPRDSPQLGVPCKNIVIGLAPLNSEESLREVPTDAGGRFIFPSITSGQYQLFTVIGKTKKWFGPFTTNRTEALVVIEE